MLLNNIKSKLLCYMHFILYCLIKTVLIFIATLAMVSIVGGVLSFIIFNFQWLFENTLPGYIEGEFSGMFLYFYIVGCILFVLVIMVLFDDYKKKYCS